MARGRIIQNKITKDKRFNDFASDTSRLAFVLLNTYADVEGRTHGDPAVVRSLVFPRRDDISLDQIEQFIVEWVDAGFIEWYEAEGDLWISFVDFDENQPNLRKDREPDSIIPADGTPAINRQDSGNQPAECQQNDGVREEKQSEVEEKVSEENSLVASATTDPAPAADSDYQEIRQAWSEIFPNKPQPRSANQTLSGKAKTRMKSVHFQEHWRGALIRASRSKFCNGGSWFSLGWFLKNDDHYERCLNGKYDGSKNGPDPKAQPAGQAAIDSYKRKHGMK